MLKNPLLLCQIVMLGLVPCGKTSSDFTKSSKPKLTARAEISRAKWLVFLEPGTYTEFFNGTNIPFNCQFIVGEEDD
ncbi:hypothetical protein C0J52_13338 [Blattella germanica]|nr:hypothetical protein C0J52_13338 [Blattella germanica]